MEDEKINEVNFNKVTQWLEEYHFYSECSEDLRFKI